MSRVSCIMPTANRRPFIPAAIRLFLAQDYRDKELIVLDDGPETIEDLIPVDPRIVYRRLRNKHSVGAKRNLACDLAQGEIILHWDDDDWYAPWRISYQVKMLETLGVDICGLKEPYFVDASAEQAWKYKYPESARIWLCGATLCFRKDVWRLHRFEDINVGEDTRFVYTIRNFRIAALDDHRFFVGRIHRGNTSPKRPNRSPWQPLKMTEIYLLVGNDWRDCFGADDGMPFANSIEHAGPAIVVPAGGIGDILRATILIRLLYQSGFQVDVLATPDEPSTADLLLGAPEIRNIWTTSPKAWGKDLEQPFRGSYAVAVFTKWSGRLCKVVQAERRYYYGAVWHAGGDIAAIKEIARDLGWVKELPHMFAMHSGRRFDISEGAIALHPGCKANWPWKRWHGFGELAELLSNVVLVGTPNDLDNRDTYFRNPYRWPPHVKNFIGELSLRDTAALIAQCTALVAPDSGLMHLGVALRTPTFGIFGITNPLRECVPSPFMTPVTKQLPCEEACRLKSWGRRDCEYHLECLKSLTPHEVLGRVRAGLIEQTTPTHPKAKRRTGVTLNYFGEVYHASGYGEAARAYIHAFHDANIEIHVTNTSAPAGMVKDELVASLEGYAPNADFNLFHGIPSFWARLALNKPNVIAMTVWEADRMPRAWRVPLSHAVDVWLPSTFNVETFGADLPSKPFCLPHALMPMWANVADLGESTHLGALDIAAEDFVFYSIFEWQNRKNPDGLITAFLETFHGDSDAVLLLKVGTNSGDEARRTVDAVRSKTKSLARVIVDARFLSQDAIRAIHERGNCYVSLHRGEGWGYPLFEAAGRGKPVVATGFGGPLDYLDKDHSWLVKSQIGPVRSPYFMYKSSMKWAEPILSDAALGLRWVYDNRFAASERALEWATVMHNRYSLRAVGETAKGRLLDLQRRKVESGSITRQSLDSALDAVGPIPGDWYDEDYFERGVKSNWIRGYSWSDFCGLFRETAQFLHASYPSAVSYLDAGCAKGFLVKALRELGLEASGFEHSRWAFDHAEADVRPFIRYGGIDEVTYEKSSVDVVVAMSILESLTEDQISSFLVRARTWTRLGILATIPYLSDRDRDRSHITRRDPEWWQSTFAVAGWRQTDAYSAIASHPLPQKMNWNIYAFAPR